MRRRTIIGIIFVVAGLLKLPIGDDGKRIVCTADNFLGGVDIKN